MSVTRNAACGETACVALRLGRLPDDLAVRRRWISRIIRGGTWTPPLAERAVGRGQVERPDLDGPDRAGQPGLEERLACRPAKRMPELLGRSATASLPTRCERPDRRDVERVLERLADEDRAAIELVGVARRPAARPNVGRDVEQEAARRQARFASNAVA